MTSPGADRYEVEGFAFIGRTFGEYRRLFDLEPAALAGQSVLDCPGGPSSFTAVATEIGADVTAVDPQYGPGATELEAICESAIRDTLAELRAKRDLFVWEYYGDVDTRIRYLRAAATRFLADYGHNPGRYLQAALPDLPFPANSFDLALSANFCFLYDDRLDADFHVAALRELARVADEVRVFPLASLDTTRSEYVTETAEALRDEGYAVGKREVPYEFQPGATEMLVVRG